MDEIIEKLSDHYIICGYGRMGQQIVKDLQRDGVPFVVVETNPEQLPKLAENDIPYVEGKASEDKTLLKAGIRRAKGLISVAPTDEDNVFIVLTARGLNRELFIVARSILEENEDKLKRAGADRVMSPYILGGHRMATSVVQPDLVDFLDLVAHSGRTDVTVGTVKLSNSSPSNGKTLGQLNVWQACGVTVLAVRRDGDLYANPEPEYVLQAEDELILMGTDAQINAARECITA